MIFDKKNPVAKDYRDNIIVEKDNPVLAYKANQDHFFDAKNQKKYAGRPKIGSIYSEDAIIWNVFRTLEINNSIQNLEILIGELKEPKTLLWTLSFSKASTELQFIVGDTIRSIDGKFRGQITEPDVIIATSDSIYIIECKLGRRDTYPEHLWEAIKGSEGPEKRYKDYFVSNKNPFNKDISLGLYKGKGYQLYRMAFYSYQIGKKLGLSPKLISITNKNWWHKKTRTRKQIKDIWEEFTKDIDKNKLEIKNIFWQDVRDCLKITIDSKFDELNNYLQNHICL